MDIEETRKAYLRSLGVDIDALEETKKQLQAEYEALHELYKQLLAAISDGDEVLT